MMPEPRQELVDEMFHRLVEKATDVCLNGNGEPTWEAIKMANEVIAEGPEARAAMIRAIEQWMALAWAQGAPN